MGRSFLKLVVGNLYVVSYIDDPPVKLNITLLNGYSDMVNGFHYDKRMDTHLSKEDHIILAKLASLKHFIVFFFQDYDFRVSARDEVPGTQGPF